MVFDTLASSYDCLTVGSAITLPKERADVIEQAARDCLKARFSSHLIFDVRVREVRVRPGFGSRSTDVLIRPA